MGMVIRRASLAISLLVTASCASTTGETGGTVPPGTGNREIAALNIAIEKEKNATVLPGLLFERGHAYLEEAESVRKLRGNEEKSGLEFARLLLGALRDFDDVATNFPQSIEAPEALFHLGIAYDYANLSNFGIALKYYNQTIEKYPSTESAGKARIAIDKIEAYMRDVLEGQHGKH